MLEKKVFLLLMPLIILSAIILFSIQVYGDMKHMCPDSSHIEDVQECVDNYGGTGGGYNYAYITEDPAFDTLSLPLVFYRKENVTFDCNGHSLNGNGANYGIEINSCKNLTIINCSLSNLAMVYVYIVDSSNITINFTNISINYSMNPNGFGIELDGVTKDIFLSNLNISGSHENNGAPGIMIGQNSNLTYLYRVISCPHNPRYPGLDGVYRADADLFLSCNQVACDYNTNAPECCQYSCAEGLPQEPIPGPLPCNITNASIFEYCNGDGCKIGEKIKMNFTVEDSPNCNNLNKMTIFFKEIPEDPEFKPDPLYSCHMVVQNSTLISKWGNPTHDTFYYSDWLISSISPYCYNKKVNVSIASLYNSTDLIGKKEGSFGIFNFSDRDCKITRAGITKYCGADNKCNTSENITISISVENPNKCLGINNISMLIREDPFTELSCIMTISNSTPKLKPGNYYIGNWTIPEIPENCKGKTMKSFSAYLYNDSQNLVALKSGSFGSFEFWKEQQIYPCKIKDALTRTYCNADNDPTCNIGEKIEMNMSLENYEQCNALNMEKVVMRHTGDIGGDCFLVMENSSIIKNPSAKRIVGNWTISPDFFEQSPECSGKTVEINEASLFNTSGKKIGLKTGSFGQVIFKEVSGTFNLTVRTCETYLDLVNGSCKTSLNKNINVDGTGWVPTPVSFMLPRGWHNVSFSSDSTSRQRPKDIFVNLPPKTILTGVYAPTTNQLIHSTIIIEAVNSTGQYINARIRLYNDTGFIKEATNKTTYNQTGTLSIYPVNYTIEFLDIPGSGYNKPVNSSFNLTGKGIYQLKYFYSGTHSGHPDCYCQEGSTIVDCGQCYSSGSLFKYCNRSSSNQGVWVEDLSTDPDEDCYGCCTSRYLCAQGRCQRTGTTETCNDIIPMTQSRCDRAGFFCYWDKPDGLPGENPPATFCKHCTDENQKPYSCSDYDNMSTCKSDRCHVSNVGCPSGALSCNCEWNISSSKCYLDTSHTGSSPDDNICCDYSISFGTCEQGCLINGNTQENSRKKTTTCIGECTGMICNRPYNCTLTAQPDGTPSETKTDCIDCGISKTTLPFFTPWQMILVILLVSVYYIINIKKNRKE